MPSPPGEEGPLRQYDELAGCAPQRMLSELPLLTRTMNECDCPREGLASSSDFHDFHLEQRTLSLKAVSVYAFG